MFDRLAFDWVGVLGTGGCRLYVVFIPHLNGILYYYYIRDFTKESSSFGVLRTSLM